VVASSSSLLKFLSKSTAKSLPCKTTDRTELADGACSTEFTEQRESFELTRLEEPCKSTKEMEGPHELTDLMLDDLGLGVEETQGLCAQSHTSGLEEAGTPSPCSSTKQPGAEDMLATGTMVELPTTSQVSTDALARPRQHARHTSRIQEGSSQSDAFNPATSSSGCSPSEETPRLCASKPAQPQRPRVCPESVLRLRRLSAPGSDCSKPCVPRRLSLNVTSEAGKAEEPSE